MFDGGNGACVLGGGGALKRYELVEEVDRDLACVGIKSLYRLTEERSDDPSKQCGL